MCAIAGGQVDAIDASDVAAKSTAGFEVSFNDIFGRQLSDSLTSVFCPFPRRGSPVLACFSR